MKTNRRILALLLAAAVLLSLGAAALAAPPDGMGPPEDLTPPEAEPQAAAEAEPAAETQAEDASIVREGAWYYTVTGGEATIVKSANTQDDLELWPASLGGYPVTGVGSGAQRVTSNNKTPENLVLFPDSYVTLNTLAFYDYNNTALWSFPAAMVIQEGAMISCTEGNIQRYAAANFTATALDGGWMQPNGSYAVSQQVMGKTQDFVIEADIGYQIARLIVDGAPLTEAAGKTSYTLNYTFSQGSAGIQVSFDEFPEDTRTVAQAESYVPVDLLDGAVAEGAALQDDVYAQALVNGNENDTVDYNNAIGLNNALYSAADGKLYQLVGYSVDQSAPGGPGGSGGPPPAGGAGGATIVNNRNERLLGGELITTELEVTGPHFNSVAEVINYFYTEYGLVYGRDYDYVRMYNYKETIRNGPADMRGDTAIYGAYLFKTITADQIGSLDGAAILADYNTNIATIQVREGGDLYLSDVSITGSPRGIGPQEASNFYGMGAGLQIEGGLGSRNTLSDGNLRSQVLTGDSFRSLLVLDEASLNTSSNGIFATGHGSVVIHGGNMFALSGHGPYASYGGQILINVYDPATGQSDFIDADGYVITDPALLEGLVSPRPDPDSAVVRLDETGSAAGVFESGDGVTRIITAGEAGTTLAMDTGGGMLVSNNVVAKAYGLRSACIYSIGSEQSFEYLFNSYVVSVMDAALCSCDGGYIFAYNVDSYGIMGIKTRSGGDGDDQIHTLNSRIATYFNIDDIGAFYDVYDAQQIIDDPVLYEYLLSLDDETITSDYDGSGDLNFFMDRVNSPHFNQPSLDWWFTDRNLTPGYNGGAKFAVILLQAGTGVTVENTSLYNRNYDEYGPDSQWWAEHQGQVNDFTGTAYAPAENLLISVQAESGGMGGSGTVNGTVTFINENSRTKWDLTGEDDGTCELVGDFFVDEGNTLDAAFINSEWTGTVDGTGASLSFDADSTWNVTGDVTLESLEAEKPENITSETPVTITYYYSDTISDGLTIGNVTFKLAHKFFTDVVQGAAYVDALAEDGIVKGTAVDGVPTGLFNPDEPMQRLHFGLMLLRALDQPDDPAQAAGLLGGTEGILTAEEAYAALYAVAGDLDITSEAPDQLGALSELGVYDPALVGDQELTRLQAAILLAKLLENKPVMMMFGPGGMMPPDGMMGDPGMMPPDGMMGGPGMMPPDGMMGDPGMGGGMAPPAG